MDGIAIIIDNGMVNKTDNYFSSMFTIEIYHDFLPSPIRGSYVKSDNTHTIIQIHPLTHILDTCALIFSSCALFTVYPNSIMQRHPTLLQVITTRAREGGPKGHRAQQKCPDETYSVIYVPGLSTLSCLSHCRAASTVISILPNATFRPIHPA